MGIGNFFGGFFSSTQVTPPYAPRVVRPGILGALRDTVGNWFGPTESKGTSARRGLEEEKVKAGPFGVAFPWFLPYNDNAQTPMETQAKRLAYRQMMSDPAVKAAVLGKILQVASLDLKIHPANKKSKRDQAIAEFVRWNLTKRLDGGVPELIWLILSGAMIDGYSVNEKIFCPQETGKYAGKVALKALKQKDTLNDVVLQTDDYRNIIGVMGVRYNAGQVYHPDEFVIFTHLKLFETPTGTSDFQAAYRAYWLADTAWKLRAMGLEKRALPVVIGWYKTPQQKPSLEAALQALKSTNWLSVPEGVRAEAMDIAGRGDDLFKSAIADLKHEVFLGIRGAVLQALEGLNQNAAGSSQVHKDESEKRDWHLSACIQELLNNQDRGLIKDLVDLNYFAAEYPHATLTAKDVNELKAQLAIDTGLKALGLDLKKEELYERYDREPPEDGDDVVKGQEAPAAGGMPGAGPGAAPGAGKPGSAGGVTGKPFQKAAESAARQAEQDFEEGAFPFTDLELDPQADEEWDRMIAGESGPGVPPASPFTLPKTGADTFAEAKRQVAIPRSMRNDYQQAEQLLDSSKRKGAATLGTLASKAVRRLIESPNPWMSARELFNDDERAKLAESIAAVNATAELLGRVRIRRRMDQSERRRGRTGHVAAFAEVSGEILPWQNIIERVKLSPNLATRKIDWDHYARRFGVEGRFIKGMADVSRLWELADEGALRHSISLTTATVRLKARDRNYNPIIITREPGRKFLVVDGNHSMEAALLAGEIEIPVIVSEQVAPEIFAGKEEKFSEQNSFTGKMRLFADLPTSFTAFVDRLEPMVPLEALGYFQGLEPRLNVQPGHFGEAHERDAFTMAAALEQEILEKVQQLIAMRLETGEGIGAAQSDIDSLLDDAGLTPRNPQYSEMVVRTNMMDAYNVGSTKELQDPDVIGYFPAWRYVGIRDGRQGADHEPHFDKHYPSTLAFAAVRDSLVVKHGEVVPSHGKGRPYNCRCSMIPIDKYDWAELQKRGVTMDALPNLEFFAEGDKFNPNEPRDSGGKWTSGGGGAATKTNPSKAPKEQSKMMRVIPRNGRKSQIDVEKNPTVQDMTNWLKANGAKDGNSDSEGELRGLAANGNVYIWDAVDQDGGFDLYHEDVAYGLGVDSPPQEDRFIVQLNNGKPEIATYGGVKAGSELYDWVKKNNVMAFAEPGRFAEHDVSDEARDTSGKWTKGGGGGTATKEPEDADAWNRPTGEGPRHDRSLWTPPQPPGETIKVSVPEMAGRSTDVVKNPNADEIKNWLKANARSGVNLRGMVDGEDVYVWDEHADSGEELYHNDVAGELGLDDPSRENRFQIQSYKGQPQIWTYSGIKKGGALDEWANRIKVKAYSEPRTETFAEPHGFPWDDGATPVALATCARCGTVLASNDVTVWCPGCGDG